MTGASRLTSANETGQGNWSEAYGYANGNRWVGTRSGLAGLTNETPQSSSWFNAANQITGFSYSNGNVTQTGSVAKTLSFDAEDQMTQATVNGVTSAYVFDGLGQRVAKTVPKSGAGTLTTKYVYTADGTLAAEYSSDLLPSECGVQTCFVTVDQVGSTRMVTDSAGNVTRRYDYLPFGQELGNGVGGRTASMGYAAAGTDTFELKYAGQVRDAETGLDHMGLRMYSPEQGRFVGVDPDNAGAAIGVPDSWNGYAYVGNNPVNLTDPSGLATCVTCATASSGNPVAIGIGVAIDVGALLYEIFGHGGGNAGLAPDVWRELDRAGGFGNSFGPGDKCPNGDCAPGTTAPSGIGVRIYDLGNLGTRFEAWAIDNLPNPLYFPPRRVAHRQPLTIPAAAGVNNSLPTQGLNWFTLPGTNYCGPGGGGTPRTRVDAACAAHDRCYENEGVTWANNVGLARTTRQQSAAIRGCDRGLENTIRHIPWATSDENGQATFVSTWFGFSRYSLRP